MDKFIPGREFFVNPNSPINKISDEPSKSCPEKEEESQREIHQKHFLIILTAVRKYSHSATGIEVLNDLNKRKYRRWKDTLILDPKVFYSSEFSEKFPKFR